MILDCHIHIWDRPGNKADFLESLKKAGIDGGIVISLAPPSFRNYFHEVKPFKQRVDNLFRWVDGNPDLYPFFWIDPTEEDAINQVEETCERGVAGFKIICDHFYPGDERAMPVYWKIAQKSKPILFHAGILWDGKPSAYYNRPGEFEAVIEIPSLKIALAHVGWPWVDECLAVYGKFCAGLRRKMTTAEMFIDLSPGTPMNYREETLTKVHKMGYEVENTIMFGTDKGAEDFPVDVAKDMIAHNKSVFTKLGLNEEQQQKAFADNLVRFIGI